MVRSRWLSVFVLTALLPLAACGTDDTDAEMEGEMMEEPADEMAGDEMGETGATMMEPMMVSLEPKNESGVTGEATATHHADSVTVEVNVMGASVDGSYPAHVHSGDCATPGGVLVPLTSLEVSGGQGMSTTEIMASEVPQDQGAVIQVHNPEGQPVACADLPGHGEAGGMGEMGDTAGGGGA